MNTSGNINMANLAEDNIIMLESIRVYNPKILFLLK
jgi:hypothetical protein